MSDKTVIQDSGQHSIKCAACGEEIRIFDEPSSLPDTFPIKCGHCGEEAYYSKGDIKSS